MSTIQRNDLTVTQTEPARVEDGRLSRDGVRFEATYINNSGETTSDTDAHCEIRTADGAVLGRTVVGNGGFSEAGDPVDLPEGNSGISQKNQKTYELVATFKDPVSLQPGGDYRLAVRIAELEEVIDLEVA